MNFASKVKQNSKDPRKWIGRKSVKCRKHPESDFYVNRFLQIACLACDEPDNYRVLLTLCAHDGVWYDKLDGFEIEASQDATSNESENTESAIDWAMGAFPKPPEPEFENLRFGKSR